MILSVFVPFFICELVICVYSLVTVKSLEKKKTSLVAIS